MTWHLNNQTKTKKLTLSFSGTVASEHKVKCYFINFFRSDKKLNKFPLKILQLKKNKPSAALYLKKFGLRNWILMFFFWPKQSNQLKAEVPVSDWSRIADQNTRINKASQASVAIAAINKYNFNDKLLITQYMRILSSFFN